jgi:uroporphyrinogen-III decarboxylase
MLRTGNLKSDKMTPKERLLSLVQKKPTDRVPVIPFSKGYSAKQEIRWELIQRITVFKRILKRMREKIRKRQYVMTLHAAEEMDNDELTIYDVERGIRTGTPAG